MQRASALPRCAHKTHRAKLVPTPRRLALRFALIEGLSFGQVLIGTLHEVGLGRLATKAVGMALERRIDRAIRLYVLMVGKAPGFERQRRALVGSVAQQSKRNGPRRLVLGAAVFFEG